MSQESRTRFIDTHCHLDFPDFNLDREDVIKRAKEEGLEYIINIGSSLRGSGDAVAFAQKYDCIYATVGLHPHEADSFNNEIKSQLISLAKNNKVVAIGEIGLDYFKSYSRPDNQKVLFTELLRVAGDLGLPVVIHNRQAEAETIKILKETRPVGAVVHCFSGDERFLKVCLDLGFFISFTCNITYRKADNLRNLVKITPLEKLFLETDAPFLPPEGFRGKRNDPWQVKLLAQEIARIKQISIEEVAATTTTNAIDFFNLR